MTNISHLPVDYLVDYAGNLDTVGHLSHLCSPFFAVNDMTCAHVCASVTHGCHMSGSAQYFAISNTYAAAITVLLS